jgi:DNA-binding PadR family transcriptional regulator
MLLEPTGSHYGFELALHAGVPNGTIYPALRRLEQDGWVTAARETKNTAKPDKPRRTLYRR